MSSAPSIGDVVAASMVVEGAAKGYAVDRDAGDAIAGIQDALRNPGAEAALGRPQTKIVNAPSPGVQRVPPSQRPDLTEVRESPGFPQASVVEAEPEVELDIPVIDYDPELPDSIRELLEDEPDDDDDEALRYAAPASESDDDDETFGYEDELTKLKRENAKLAKKAAWADEQARNAKLAKWQAEAAKFFPLSNPETITADSRRAFIRAAEAQHNAVKNNPKIIQYRDQVIAQAQAEAEQIRLAARQQAESAWGKVVSGPGLVPAQQGSDEDGLRNARRKGDLAGAIGHLIGNVPGRR